MSYILNLRSELQIIRQTINEVGVGTYHSALVQAVDYLETSLDEAGSNSLELLFLIDSGVSDSCIAAAAAAFGFPVSEFRAGNRLEYKNIYFRLHNIEMPLPIIPGRPQAPVSIALVRDKSIVSPQPLRYLKVLHIIETDPRTSGSQVWPSGLIADSTNISDIHVAQEWLNQVLEPTNLQNLKVYSLCQALEQIAVISRDNINLENKKISFRKAVQNQIGQTVKMDESSFNSNELLSQLRLRIQAGFSDLEKNIKQQWEDANKPQTGAFFHRTVALSGQLESLEESPNLEKTEKVTLRTAPEFESQFKSQIQNTLIQRFESDAGSIQRAFNKITEGVNELLKASQVNSLTSHIDLRSKFEFRKITDSYTTFTKSYQGEMTKRGMTEYFVALREYTSLISTVVGLLMPIVIGIGGFEVIDEFVISNKNQIEQTANSPMPAETVAPNKSVSEKKSRWESMTFSQKLRTVVYTLSAVISIVMLVYGLYTLSNKIPQMRDEVYSRELRKARDTLESEGRRMFNDSTREWVSQVSNLCRDLSTNMQASAERNVKEFLQLRDKSLAESRSLALRRSQGVEMLQKRLSAVERTKDQSVQNISQLRRTLDQSLDKCIARTPGV